jgi:hypothetical protein
MRTLSFYAQKVYNGENVSRKTKKFFLGLKLSKSKIKRKIKHFKVFYHAKNLTEESLFNMQLFCPNCGCTLTRSTGNMVDYPEIWDIVYCLRCNTRVAEADNSTYTHVLEEINEQHCRCNGVSVE